MVKLDGYETYLLQVTNEVIAYLVKSGATVEDAQDMAQEAVLKILEIDTVIPSENIRAWMYRVAINRYYNLYKRNRRYKELLTLHFNGKLEEELETDFDQLYEGLQKLSVKEVDLLLMKYEQRLSFEEMGLILNQPSQSLKTTVYRVRKKLKQLMMESGD